MYLTVFQTNSSCQDKALANPPDGVCVTESFVFGVHIRKFKTLLDLDLNVLNCVKFLFALGEGNLSLSISDYYLV